MKTLLLILSLGCFFDGPDRKPMQADFQHSAAYRWLNKPVLETILLDDMESLDRWEPFTVGAQHIIDARIDNRESVAQSQVTHIELNSELVHHGVHSLKMRVPTRLDVRAPENGRGWGRVGVRRLFDGEDWQGSNRVSLWVYPESPGAYSIWMELRIFNDGEEKLPALFAQEGETSFMLRQGEWNHLVWEIGNVARDRITALEVSYYLCGNEPEASDTSTFYLDRLELQVVEPDYIEGWGVWPGRIAYTHSGYQSDAVKTALASGLEAREFRLIDQSSGQPVLRKPVEQVTSPLGQFQKMDFSEIVTPGLYVLEAGSSATMPFRIGQDAWRESLMKALDFFYAERCGTAIPGVHGVCHRDWICLHGDLMMVVNGGWHDAGDLTQILGNTGEAVYAMFSLAEKLMERGEDVELQERLIEEARWGLEWVLKTSFRDGYRYGSSANSRKTNGIIGDNDDLIAMARNVPIDHFLASAAQAIGGRILAVRDPRMAAFSLEMAEEDWRFGAAGMDALLAAPATQAFRGNFDSNAPALETVSQAIIAAVELWKATGDRTWLDQGAAWAGVITGSQQRSIPDWEIPLTGFFYTGPDKVNILHYCHRSREHLPILALTRLCEALPDHPDWMRWYSAVTLHAEYQKTIAQFTEPWAMMPASVYHDREYLQAPESRRESFRLQVIKGIPLGAGHYLRLFPVWMDYRGHFGTILPQALALAKAAGLRGDAVAARLVRHQMEWLIGRNPFAQSTMWGEGYDFTPLYSVMSGDLVGGFPVGIQTRAEEDVPYWPVQNTWTYKEIWGHPVIQWIWLMEDVALAERPDESKADFDLSVGTTGAGEVTIRATVYGDGNRRFSLRADNLSVSGADRQISPKPGRPALLEWKCRVQSPGTPWVVVVVPDGDHTRRREVTGGFPER